MYLFCAHLDRARLPCKVLQFLKSSGLPMSLKFRINQGEVQRKRRASHQIVITNAEDSDQDTNLTSLPLFSSS